MAPPGALRPVLIKPPVDTGARDPVERQCPEIRQKLGFKSVVHAFPGREFEMVVTRRLPFSLDKVTEFGHGHFHGFIRSLAGLVPELEFKAFEPRILHRFQADGAKTVAPGTASDAAVIHPGPIAGWLDPDTEAGCFRVPDRVLGLARSEPARIGVGQSYSSRRIFWHRSCLPGEDWSNCLDRRADRSMVEMRVFQRRGRIVVAEESGNRGNRRAIQEGHRGVAVPEVMQPDIAKSGLVPAPSASNIGSWSGKRNPVFAVQGISTRQAGEAHPVSARAGDDSQTVLGPVLESRRYKCPSR